MSRKNRRQNLASHSTQGGSSYQGIHVSHPQTRSDYFKLHEELSNKRFIALDVLKSKVANIKLPDAGISDMANQMGCGSFANGPLTAVAWSFDGTDDTVVQAFDKDHQKLGNGYVKWGAADNIPNVIPPLALASPYTAAPLRYIAELMGGLGVRLFYRTGPKPDDIVEYKNAGDILQQRIDELEAEEEEKQNEQQTDNTEDAVADDGTLLRHILDPDKPKQQKENKALKRARELYDAWDRSWNGFDVLDNPSEPDGTTTHVPGAKQFLEENNMTLHFQQWAEDYTKLDIAYPTIGLQRGRSRRWDIPVKPRIVRTDVLPAHSCRLGLIDPASRVIKNVYYSDSLRRKGALGVHVTTNTADDNSFKMYPCAMPQHLLSEIRYQVENNNKVRIKDRPTWIVCPTLYPSGNKPYYPQPAWWSIFTSKAYDFSATILYDKYKQRENSTNWGRIIYISLDYLDQVFADEGYQGNKEKQQEFIDNLDNSIEQFLQQRENNGKMMRQFMWTGADGKEHKNVEVVDVKETSNDQVTAGKAELELSTSPIFLALQVDPRLVGVPMVAASNGGTALREMQLLKQQMLNPHQRNYCNFLNAIATYNEWDRAEWHIVQQTLTTLDASKTGTVETISGQADQNDD